MQKTGESYTAARLQLLNKHESTRDLATLAGMSDESVRKLAPERRDAPLDDRE